MNKITFSVNAWQEYTDCQTSNKNAIKKINSLIKDIARNPTEGIGKPERLVGYQGDVWSRRIDDKNRLVYRVLDNEIEIIQCQGHYSDH